MAAGLDLGTLTVKLAADVEDLKKGLADATRQTEATNKALKRMGDVAFGAVEGLGGAFNEASTMLKKTRKGVEDLFGEDATAAGQAWGRELQKSVGLTEAQVKGLGQAVKGLEGAFEVAAMASKALLSPLGAALFAVVGLTAAWGGLKQLLNTKGWLPEFMDEPWFQAFKPGATPGWEGVDFNRRAPGPKGAAAQQAYGKFFDPVTGQYKTAGPVTSVPDPGPAGPGLGERAKDAFAAAMEGFTKSMKEGAKDFEPALKAFLAAFDNLTPGAKKKVEAAKKEKNSVNEWSAYDEKGAAELKRTQEKYAESQLAMRRAEQEMFERVNQEYWDTAELELSSLRERQQHQRALDDMAAEEIKAAQKRVEDQWLALGAGRLGDAFGVKGLGGGVLNMLGTAASGYQRTGAVLQGAGQGLQSSGGNPWGALIGAIVGLLTQTDAFSQILGGIEDILGDVVGLLDTTMKPIVKVLNPIFKIIGDLISAIDMVTTALDGVIGEQGMGKSIGDKDSTFGKYSLNDWINGGGITPLLSELGNWIGDKLEDKDAAYKDYKKQSIESLQAQNTDSLMSTRLMGDASYQSLMAANYYSQREAGMQQHDLERQFAMAFESMHELEIRSAYLNDAIYDLGSQATQSANELYMLNTAQGAEAYIQAQVEAAKTQARKNELDLIAHDRLAALGLAADDAAQSVQEFSDAFKNVPVGYKLALSMYGATTATGSGGGGGGGPSGMPSQPTASGGGGGGGGTFNVTIQSDDPQRIWSQLKQLMARDNYVRGGTLAARAPAGV